VYVMKSYQQLSRLLLVVLCALPLLATAKAVDYEQPNHHGKEEKNRGHLKGDFLSPVGANTGLETGMVSFGQFASSFDGEFSDRWTFSLAEDSKVKVTLSEFELGGRFNLLDIDALKFEVFDSSNNSLGSIGTGNSLKLFLAANNPYSFVVSGIASGMLGGFYFGSLQICAECAAPTPVPLGDGLPFFAAALLFLGWQMQRRPGFSVRF